MEERIRRFLYVEKDSAFGAGSSSGYGSAFGSGSISVSGYGEGSGEGSATGSGDGSGYGSGDGSCYGYGSGDGSTSGGGSGSGDGDGYGFDSGIIKLNGYQVYYIDSIATIIKQIRGNLAKGYIISSDLTVQPCYIARYGDYFAHGETAKKARTDALRKHCWRADVDTRLREFIKLFGEGKHSGHEFFKWHGMLTGSCEFGRSEFVKEKGIDLDGKYTMEEFVAMVKDSYGDEIIKKLIPT